MNAQSKIVTLLLLMAVFWIATEFVRSSDWRNRALGWSVIIVYILLSLFKFLNWWNSRS